jgi:hypothetical protein
MPGKGITRAQAAVLTLAHTRAEARALLMSHGTLGANGQSSQFPRSKIIRWLLTHPVGGWLGSALLRSASLRLPLGPFIRTRIIKRKI